MSGAHDHSDDHQSVGRGADRGRLARALAITSTVLLAEIVGGLLSGSLALLADAAHMFTDMAALLLAFAAATLAEQKSSRRYTFGLYRAEILAAFVNAQILLLAGVWILHSAWQRLWEAPELDTGLMFWVASLGLLANLLALVLLQQGNRENLNLRAAYLEVFSDTLGSAAVIVTALVIPRTGWTFLDPVVSAVIAVAILPRTFTILRESAHVLLEGSPLHTDLATVHDQISAIPGVVGVHDFHFWTLTSGLDSVSVHVRIAPETERFSVRRQVEALLREQFRVQHLTVQIEEASEAECCAPSAHR